MAKARHFAYVLLVFLIAACNLPGTATVELQQDGQDPTAETAPTATQVPFQPTMAVIGPEEIIFNWSHESCEPEDIPDLPARAYQDEEGDVHLITAHIRNRALVGPDLNQVARDCAVVMESDHQSDPAQYNDNEWIAAVYTEDGINVYAIVHNEYHGWEHDDCGADFTNFSCWYNALTLVVSKDGGRTFTEAAPAPDHFVAGLPYPYEAGAGPYGLLEPSNILKAKDGFYYQIARADDYNSDDQWLCLNRTDDLSDPNAWRGWDGNDFTVRYLSPYQEMEDPSQHLCEPLSPEETGLMAQSLTYNAALDRYVLLGLSADHLEGREVWGIYYSFSEDLIHWTPRQLLWERELFWTWQPGDEKMIHFPTLLDPDSPSMSFDVIDNQAYLYYTKFHESSPLNRDLVRVPVEFFETRDEAQAADTRTKLALQPTSEDGQALSVSGKLTTIHGIPVGAKQVELLATQTSGPGEYFEYQLSGRIPEEATRAILGYRSHIECDCLETESEIWLYNLGFEVGEEGTNLVPNPDFGNGLASANLWNGASFARVLDSDRGQGNMLHVRAEEGQSSAGDLANINVPGAEIFTVKFGARVPPAAEGTGLFVLAFLNNSGELIRHVMEYAPPALPVGSAETEQDGSFVLTWEPGEVQRSLQVLFAGDDRYLPTSAEVDTANP